MLDLARLERLKLVRRPRTQRFFGRMLEVNYRWLPGVERIVENPERIPDTPVIFAMNHTDRYNYFPFQYELWKRFDRFTATWVKGKYYEHPFVAWFMESMLQLPTVSRGYLITRDFLDTLERKPTDHEYAVLRAAVDERAVGGEGKLPSPPELPEKLLSRRRAPMGLTFDPEQGDYPDYICSLYRTMMARFVALNEAAVAIGLDLLIFPQGTRSRRLLPGHVGISQIALHLKLPIVPIGCNGSDRAYPGSVPVAHRGRIVMRVGEPISWEELAPFHVEGGFTPFSASAERDHARAFEGIAALVTDRIEALLDPEYRRADGPGPDAPQGTDRFV